MKTLQDYLTENYCQRGIMDYHIRAFVPEAHQIPTLYVHPRDTDGETLDFVVIGNHLSPLSDVSVSGLPGLPAESQKAITMAIAAAVDAKRSGKFALGEAKMCLTSWGARFYAWRARRSGFQTTITDCGPYQRQELGGRYSVALSKQNP